MKLCYWNGMVSLDGAPATEMTLVREGSKNILLEMDADDEYEIVEPSIMDALQVAVENKQDDCRLDDDHVADLLEPYLLGWA